MFMWQSVEMFLVCALLAMQQIFENLIYCLSIWLSSWETERNLWIYEVHAFFTLSDYFLIHWDVFLFWCHLHTCMYHLYLCYAISRMVLSLFDQFKRYNFLNMLSFVYCQQLRNKFSSNTIYIVLSWSCDMNF